MFYDRFKQLCEEKGVKPTNACVEAGFSRGLAAKWKAEKTEVPRADILQKLSVYFGMTIDEILGNEPKNEEKPTIQEDDGLLEGLTEIDMDIIKKLPLLSPEQKKEYSNYLAYLLSKQEL